MAATPVRVGGVRTAGAARVTSRRITLWQIFFLSLLAVYISFVTALLVVGWSYYSTEPIERSLHPYYNLLKPSGAVGHSLGIVGTAMMLMIFLYSARKKSKLLQSIGTQAQWLQVHIFFGFAGPILVTFHTTGKLGGIVSIAFYSMWAMVLSGMVGRYLYAKIPRTMQGNQMSLKEIEDQLAQLVQSLQRSEKKEDVLRGIEAFLARTRRQSGGVLSAILRVLRDDLRLPFNAVRIWRLVGADPTLSFARRWSVSHLVLKQQRLLNHLAVLDASKRLFSYWHIFHKPFTVLTFVIVFLHVAVAVYWGYGFQWR
jgi:hypothetical protein